MIKNLFKVSIIAVLFAGLSWSCNKNEDEQFGTGNGSYNNSGNSTKDELPDLRLDSISADTLTALDTFTVYGSGFQDNVNFMFRWPRIITAVRYRKNNPTPL